MAAGGARAAAERMRRIGVLMPAAADERNRRPGAGFPQGLQDWAGPLAATYGSTFAGRQAMPRNSQHAAELVALAPDVILAPGGTTVAPLQQATRTVPIVFARSPIRSVPALSIAWRGRAAMSPGFMLFEYEHERQMAGTAQGDRAARDASSGPPGPGNRWRSASLARSNPWRRRSGWS